MADYKSKTGAAMTQKEMEAYEAAELKKKSGAAVNPSEVKALRKKRKNKVKSIEDLKRIRDERNK